MPTKKVAITLERDTLQRLDSFVDEQGYPSRSSAIQEAVQEKLDRVDRTRLAVESAKLDPAFEQQLADEGLAEDLGEWPEY
jgi:metal-responsive CopG/Arc/MetJ family transcriptional regulator